MQGFIRLNDGNAYKLSFYKGMLEKLDADHLSATSVKALPSIACLNDFLEHKSKLWHTENEPQVVTVSLAVVIN